MCRRDDGVNIVQRSRTRSTANINFNDERPLSIFREPSAINAIPVALNVPRFGKITPVWLPFKSVIIIIGFVIPVPTVVARRPVEHVAIITTYRNSGISTELARSSEIWRIYEMESILHLCKYFMEIRWEIHSHKYCKLCNKFGNLII